MPELYSAKKVPEQPAENNASPPLTDNSLQKPLSRDFLPAKKGNSLSSLLVKPANIAFETQDPEEEILMIARAHWITNLPWLAIALLLFFAPAVLRFFPLLDSFPVRFQLIFVVVWYLILLMYIFERFLSWFFNMTIITDERIVDVDFLNLTTKKVADADLDKIQDVSFANTGVFGTIFDFGNVLVQTAAEVTEFVFENVPDPAGIAKILQRLRTEEKIEAIEGRVR
ncbi:MAG: hypothetical protein ACPLY7_02545 [Microgenomates group bacterium]